MQAVSQFGRCYLGVDHRVSCSYCPRERRALRASGLEGAVESDRGANEGEVGEGLREVAEQFAA